MPPRQFTENEFLKKTGRFLNDEIFKIGFAFLVLINFVIFENVSAYPFHTGFIAL